MSLTSHNKFLYVLSSMYFLVPKFNFAKKNMIHNSVYFTVIHMFFAAIVLASALTAAICILYNTAVTLYFLVFNILGYILMPLTYFIVILQSEYNKKYWTVYISSLLRLNKNCLYIKKENEKFNIISTILYISLYIIPITIDTTFSFTINKIFGVFFTIGYLPTYTALTIFSKLYVSLVNVLRQYFQVLNQVLLKGKSTKAVHFYFELKDLVYLHNKLFGTYVFLAIVYLSYLLLFLCKNVIYYKKNSFWKMVDISMWAVNFLVSPLYLYFLYFYY